MYVHIYSDILSDILSSMYSDILSGIISGIYSDILSGMYSDILSGINSGIRSGIFSHSYWHSIWHLFWHSVWHSFWQSICLSFWNILGSRSAQLLLELGIGFGFRRAQLHPELPITELATWLGSVHAQVRRVGRRRRRRTAEEVEEEKVWRTVKEELHLCQNLETSPGRWGKYFLPVIPPTILTSCLASLSGMCSGSCVPRRIWSSP